MGNFDNYQSEIATSNLPSGSFETFGFAKPQHHTANSPFLWSHITYSRDEGEFLILSTEFMLSNHILYSHNFSD